VTNVSLAQSYRVKATKRLKILPVLLADAAYSDVVGEAQEIVELALKGMLRHVGIEPPKWHDVRR
jgi:HEPN domain-containing protein